MDASTRTERLLALMLMNQMHGSTQSEKILQLSLAGFTHYEIADIVQTTYGFVAKSLSVNRRAKAGPRRTKPKP